MLKRYRIVDDNTLERGDEKLSAYLDEQTAKPQEEVAINAQ